MESLVTVALMSAQGCRSCHT